MARSLISLVCVALAAASLAPAAAADDPHALQPPVAAPVLDPYRPPSSRYGPGNRGIEYDTARGDRVVAAAPGTVVFAGIVGAHLHVTVDHGGGLKSSYSFLDRVTVRRGDTVARGDAIGVAGPTLHFGVRLDGEYVDPMAWFGRRVVDVRLVPTDDDVDPWAYLATVAAHERAEFNALLMDRGEGGSGLRGLVDLVARTVVAIHAPRLVPSLVSVGLDDQLRRLRDQLVWMVDLGVEASLTAAHVEWLQLAIDTFVPRPCTGDDVAVQAPAERRIAVVVDGLASSSERPGAMDGLDLAAHGYDPVDRVRFSYAGGAVPAIDAGWQADLPQASYTEVDTRASLDDSAARLASLLADVAEHNPGVPIDVYGHSLGGILARVATSVRGPGAGIETVITIAAPLEGAPLATVATAAAITTLGQALAPLLGQIDLDSRLGAPVLDDLDTVGLGDHDADDPLPVGVRSLAIGGRTDVFVPATVSDGSGPSFIVDTGLSLDVHNSLPGHPQVARGVSLTLAGLPPPCESWSNRLTDLALGLVVENTTQVVAGGIGWLDWRGSLRSG